MKHLTLRRIASSLLVPSFASEYKKLLTHKRQQATSLFFVICQTLSGTGVIVAFSVKKCIVFPSLKSILTAATPLNVVVS
jgi:hypothetical protein